MKRNALAALMVCLCSDFFSAADTNRLPLLERSLLVFDISGQTGASNLVSHVQNRYDRAGNIVEIQEFDVFGALCEKRRFTYDSKGNQTFFVLESSNGEVRETSEDRYDRSGRLTESIRYGEKRALESRSVYRYDRFGKKSEYLNFDKNREMQEHSIYRYDRNGNLVEWKGIDEAGETQFRWTYRYDMRSNQTEGFCVMANGWTNAGFTNEYDAAGRETVYREFDSEHRWGGKFFYDNAGRKIAWERYREGGGAASRTEYDYDAVGRTILEREIEKGKPASENRNRYRDDGQILENVFEDYRDSSVKKYLYFYGANGLLERLETWDATSQPGKLRNLSVYQYRFFEKNEKK